MFFHLVWVCTGQSSEKPNSQKFHILLILTGKNASKWLEWCTYARVWGVPNPMAFISSLYNKWFLKYHNFRQKFHILLILTGKNASKWLEWHIFRVWGMLNPMAGFESIDKWFLKNHNFRQKFHILLILTGKNASKWIEWCIFSSSRHAKSNGTMFQVSMINSSWKIKKTILGDK